MISAAPTLVALSAYGQYCQYRELSGATDSKAFLRRISENGKEYLTIVEKDQLSFFERILLFFGHPDFRLATIQRVANQALKSQTALDFCGEGGGRGYIRKAVRSLNISINYHNSLADQLKLRFLYTKIVALDRPEFTRPAGILPIKRHKYGRTKRQRIKKKKQTEAAIRRAGSSSFPSVGCVRGIVNPGCLCYSNSSYVALYASPAFRGAVQQEHGELARLLKAIFRDMGDQRHLADPITREAPGPLRALHEKLCDLPELSFLERYWEQQDAQEFLCPLLDHIFSKNHDKFSVVEHTQRAESDSHAYVGAPSLHELYLPTIDKKADTLLGNMVFAKIPTGSALYFVRDYFEGTLQTENVEVEAIIGNENNKQLTEEQKAALRKAGGLSGCLDPLLVRSSHQLKHPAPSFLPVYIPRFTERGDKNFTPVVAPFRLPISVEGEGGGPATVAQYELKSVVVHGGATRGGGHYYTYIPDPSALDGSGNPTRWVKASDSSPKELCTWEQVAQDIATQGVFFMYDKV